MIPDINAFWSKDKQTVLTSLKSQTSGLGQMEAKRRLKQFGPNLLNKRKNLNLLKLLLSQFSSPIIVILLLAAALAFFLGDSTNSLIILGIVLISGILGFWQEKGAGNAVEKLLSIVAIKASVLREGKIEEIALEKVVPGDIVMLKAGDVIPGDCLIIESKDLFVDEAALTGETFPVEKQAGIVSASAPLNKRTNSLFMGTHVVSGDAKALVAYTGANSEFGKISQHLEIGVPETEFERGIRKFGYSLMEVTLILVIAIFAINVFLARSVLDSFLFALALAVGLTPQLLPAIISINLSHGAKKMASLKVVVKRLVSIENFGSMDVLCCDKTGTLTQGRAQMRSALGLDGKDNPKVLLYAYLNAYFETGFANPIDKAILDHPQDISGFKKLDEVPYDFDRKRLSVLVASEKSNILISKGSVKTILEICCLAEDSSNRVVEFKKDRMEILQEFDKLSEQGFRVIALSYKDIGEKTLIDTQDESKMVFLGFVTLFDPPKPEISATIHDLENLGISFKMISGDNALAAKFVAREVGLPEGSVITGEHLQKMSPEALIHLVQKANIFAEIEPNQKEKIIQALRQSGNVVGYLGDGINDAPAIRAADVGISVDMAVDVAKEAADIVLLKKDLAVLKDGVKMGRVTFANTLKYVFMATSANFGNMFSMAGASLFLTFLPLLPSQILLTNLLTDFPEMTIATDGVDPEMIEKPKRWNLSFIRRFMIVFGVLSSLFDYLTFGSLLYIFHASVAQFRTGWFIESVISAALIVLVVRTRRLFFLSPPGKYLLRASLVIASLTPILPFTPVARLFNFAPLSGLFLLVIIVLVVFYIVFAEIAKIFFYKYLDTEKASTKDNISTLKAVKLVS